LPASRIERDGLAIAFTLRGVDGASRAMAGADAVAEITLTDAATGAPARGLAPLAWMTKRSQAAALDAVACREKVKSFTAGLLSVRPDVDMNAYLVWTLNQDSTLSVINPQIAFGQTKLRSIVSLTGAGASFALHPERDSLYVTIRGSRSLAVVDTRRGLVKSNVPVGADPTFVAVAPDGRTVWVGNDGDATVSVVDAHAGEVIKTLHVGAGHHEIAFTGGGRTAWITSSKGEAVTVVDGVALEPLVDIAVGPGATAIAASDEAGVVYVANGTRGEVVGLDVARRAVIHHILLQPGLRALRFEPRGRFAFALNPTANEASILDASTGAVTHTLRGLAGPDAVTFTDDFAYIHNLDAGRVSLVARSALGGAAAPPVIQVEVGQDAPSVARVGALINPITPVPEGKGVLIANPADKALYFYVEGMMAPIGTLSNYGREPRSVLVESRSLEEARPGVYSTTVHLGAEGLYDVELLLDRPRSTACLEATVEPSKAATTDPGQGITFEPLFDSELRVEAAKSVTLRFRAAAPAAAPVLEAREMEIMIVRFPAGYRWSGAPRAEGHGVFSVTFTPPAPGQYRLLPAAVSRGAPIGELPFVPLSVFAHAADAAKGGAQ
jgi:YVTN family beta-propeller protein